MPTYDVTYSEVKKIAVWVPDGASADQRKLIAMDHMALAIPFGMEGKLLSIVPTPPPGWVPPDLTDGATKIK